MTPLLDVRGIAKTFERTVVLADISFSVAAGEAVGLFGANGSGKTTLVNILSGLIAPDAGAVRFDGRDVTRLPMDARYRIGIARTFQIPRP
ncbi:MAG: ATP-binding cassette domain-containing protein, partial [Deltaproteobacteria bacterium]|nr:ATP-binding cassette domain-containing protein [Deltaproteobacteria bacterium]